MNRADETVEEIWEESRFLRARVACRSGTVDALV